MIFSENFIEYQGYFYFIFIRTISNRQNIIQKYRNSAFFGTQLDMVLRRMGVKTVVLCGTQYPNCVRGTANDAMSYDYETIVDTDASSAKTPQVAENNIYDMRNMGIKCLSLEEIRKLK